MPIGQWRGDFVLILLQKREKLLAHDWFSDCLATVYAIEKFLLKLFCNNNVSFRDSWRWIHLRIKRQERKRKHEEEHGVLEEANSEEYQSDVLDQTLSQFYAELRKRKRGWQWARLPESNAGIRNREFLNSRKVLEGKARKLREQGKGKRPNRSRSLTKEKEEVLWQNGQLGEGTPRALPNTMWWLLTQRLSLRGRQEHHQMKNEGFT